jgi:hypothetical protein
MTLRGGRWLHRLDAAYGWGLRLSPRAFRAQWGEAMRQAFRDRCREAARGERGPFALLAESSGDLARCLVAEHSLSMEEAPMKSCAIALALVLCAADLGQLVLLDADVRFVFGSLAMLGPALLFLLAIARPAWPVRLAALVLNGLMPVLFVVTLLEGKLPPLSLVREHPFPAVLIAGLFLVSPALNLAALLRAPRRAKPLAA